MSKEAMRLALEALEWCHGGEPCGTAEAITALREALAEQKSGIKQVIELYDSPDQPSQQEPVPCCGKYETCTQACTPRGRFLGKREALANEALDKMAENARELGLDYEVEPKIGCVNHDCDKCKAQQEPAQQCKWPTCQSGEYQQALAEQIKRELFGDQPAQQEPVAFEEWLAKQHGDPEEIGFLQALRISYIAGQDSITSPPAQQEPVAFPARKAVEREIERTANPTGMHLNDGKERVALPGGTLRHMLALIDRTPSPPQRTWVGLTKTVVGNYLRLHALGDQPTFRQGFKEGAAFAEAKLKEKNT